MAPSVRLFVNGNEREIRLDPERSLLAVLRGELGLTGAKPGCGEGACGACTVLVDGEPVRACQMPAAGAAGRSVTTVEGLARGGVLHPVQQAFAEVGAMQCGFCTTGMVLRAAALLERHPDADAAVIAEAMDGNVCRCCTYPRIQRAIRLAGERMRAASAAPATGARGDISPAAAGAPSAAPGALPAEVTRPAVPWDLLPAEERDYFAVLGDGLVTVAPEAVAPRGPGAASGASHHGGAWVHVGADGSVTAFTGKVDVGQDNGTAFSLLVAEELGVPAASVRLVQGDTDVCPFDMGTFGSRSMPYTSPHVRAAGAAARSALTGLAAARWGAPADAITARDGRLHGPGGRSLAYGELVHGIRRVDVVSEGAPVTAATVWRTAGHPATARGALEVVTGARRYPADVRRPGMLHGAVLRAPAIGATLREADLGRAEAMPGVRVVREGDFVGVVAASPAMARRALEAIDARWDHVPQPGEAELETHLRAHPAESGGWGPSHHEAGDAEAALADAAIRLDATYTTAYIAHVPLETRSAVAEWNAGRVSVWTATQRPFGVRAELAEALELPERAVRVVVPPTGSGYGGRHGGSVAIEAARLARAVGAPVRVAWSRAEEFTCGYFRPAAIIDVRAGARADGTLTAWTFRNTNSGSAGILCPYDIPNQRIDYQPAASPLPQGSYRALAATANHFARESHMDELAHRLGADPLDFRLRHLSDERLAAVLRAAAERAGWAERSREPGHGMGLAAGMEKGGRVATCAEVRVHPGGRLEVLRLVAAYECGTIIHPDGLENQVEGAMLMGLGGALFEAIHFADGRILNGSLNSYRVPRFRDIPPVEVILLDRPDIPSAGGGETPIVGVAPAIANAIFAACGRRLRGLPLVPDGRVR